MKEYHVEVDLLPSKALSAFSDIENELSRLDLVTSQASKGHKGFFFSGGDKNTNSGCWLDGSFKFFDSVTKYEGFMGNCLSEPDGTFTTEQIVDVSGEGITSLVITFDKVAGEYATEMMINGVVHKNYSYVFAVSLSGVAEVRIVFTKWSKVNSVVKVLGISCGITKKYNKRAYRAISFENAVVSGDDIVKFGVLTQTGTISLNDDGTLRALSDASLLDAGCAVRIYEDDVLKQVFMASNFDCDDFNGAWSISLTDDTSLWEEEHFEGISYQQRTLKQILDLLVPGIVHADVAYVSSIVIPDSFLRVSSRWNAIAKCCAIGMLRVYQINGTIYSRRIL